MTRRQLTLFLDENESQSIESIRRRFNPIQYGLIKSHITLCREDEIENLPLVQHNLAKLNVEAFELQTGKIKRFSKGKGVYLPIIDEEQNFLGLREWILMDGPSAPRAHEPHITLMHPRNSTCTDEKFEEILTYPIPEKLRISKISMIEQEIGKEWITLSEFKLK